MTSNYFLCNLKKKKNLSKQTAHLTDSINVQAVVPSLIIKQFNANLKQNHKQNALSNQKKEKRKINSFPQNRSTKRAFIITFYNAEK